MTLIGHDVLNRAGMTTTLLMPGNDPYVDLVLSFPLRPIRTRLAHQKAKEMLRSLIGRRGLAVRDYKAVLVSLIAEYERSAELRLDTSKITASEIVAHLLAERELSVNGLSKIVGVSQSCLSEMLNGKRDWSKQAIVRVAKFFGLQPGIFLRE